jgi:hypothetical protein
MKTPLKVTIGIIVVLASLSLIVGIAVRARPKDKVALGPLPSENAMPDAEARQTAEEMRKWIGDFKPADAKELNNAGKITFSWEQLKASYPEQARIVDDYVEKSRLDFVKAFEQQSKPVPDRLASHRNPDTVEIERLSNGKLRVVVSSKEGIEHAFLEIANPR